MSNVAFWHKPDRWIDPRLQWHAYDQTGMSLCGALLICGTSRPDDARKRTPKAGKCRACTSKAATRTEA